jgi:uncharacterized protein YwgA
MSLDAARYLIQKFTDLFPKQPFGKTALVKLLYFAQEEGEADLGYEFSLYTFGPFDSIILSELDELKYDGDVTVERDRSGWGYSVKPTDEIQELDLDEERKERIDAAIATYGKLTARQLEIRATLHFMHEHSDTKVKGKKLWELVRVVKPKYTIGEIRKEARQMGL